MNRFLVVLSLVLIVACAGCKVQRIEFPVHEYADLETEGTATVAGQMFMRTQGGEVKTAAGFEVFLNPVTSYSQQWWDVSYKGGRKLSPADPRYLVSIRAAVADSDGRFKFTNVANGEYFLSGVVIWQADRRWLSQGGPIAKVISVLDDKDLEVVVANCEQLKFAALR